MPLYAAPPLEAAIVFKPTPSTLGLITFARHIKKEAFHAEAEVFGEMVSERVFGS